MSAFTTDWDSPYEMRGVGFMVAEWFRIYDKYHPNDERTFASLLQEITAGNDIVELGPRKRPMVFLWQFSPRNHFCVDPSGKKNTALPSLFQGIKSDGLTYLESIQGFKGVVSFDLFDPCILREDYAANLAEEIYRKTIHGGLTFHSCAEGFERFFLNSGFVYEKGVYATGFLDSSLSPEILQQRGAEQKHKERRILTFFRKPEPLGSTN